MDITRRHFVELSAVAAGAAAIMLTACSNGSKSSTGSTNAPTGALAIDSSAWNYDADNDVYWQVGVAYCTSPGNSDYESMGIYVPGAYMTGSENSNGMYSCSVNSSGSKGSYTAASAPIVIPVNTAGYSAQSAPTSYSYDGISEYLSAGLIYAYPGLRGRDNGYDSSGALSYSGGAPWGVTDLKAAVRYLRYNATLLPGNMDRIFVFGHSGGGAQSAIAGSSGDSSLYTPYLESIGAATQDSSGVDLSDVIFGSMCWCPITSLDYADEAYEWNMGQYATTGTRADGTWTKALSNDLSNSFAEYINGLGLKDSSGTSLTLDETTDGIYAGGSYYDYLVSVVETSLNNFLSDTTFPYSPSSTTMGDGGFAGGASSGMAQSGSAPSGSAPSGSAPSGSAPSGSAPDAAAATTSSSSSETYETVDDYISSLNSDETWISYDSSSNTAKITSLGAFVKHCKTASKDVCAFDDLNRSQAENNLFGNDDSDYLHFDQTISALLASNSSEYAAYSDYDSSYADAYASDIVKTDAMGNDVTKRVAIYNPMYFLSSAYEGYGSSTPAKHWRIRTGIDQGDTALTVETNLALALAANGNVSDCDFATVWGLGHTTAERTGSSSTNFIEWVADCCK